MKLAAKTGRSSSPTKGNKENMSVVNQDSSDSDEGSTKRRKGKRVITMNLTAHCGNYTQMPVRLVLDKIGWKEVQSADPHFWWIESSQSVHEERYQVLSRAKINYFPKVWELCRKKGLTRCLNTFAQLNGSRKLNFFPPTYILPEDWPEFDQVLHGKCKTFIVKPDAGSQGAGIYLTRLGAGTDPKLNKAEKAIIQRYIHKPLLVDGLKFDFRVYMLIVSLEPVRAYVYKDGLARFCTLKYVQPNKANLDSRFAHLTNYSLNKFSATFEHSDDGTSGSKRRLGVVWEQLDSMGMDSEELWESVRDMCAQTLLAMLPHAWFSYNTHVLHTEGHPSCFQLIGVDVLLDHRGRPWLLEINNHPSLNLDEATDRLVKEPMLAEMFKICRPIFRGKPTPAPAPNSRVTFGEVTQLRERRLSKGARSAAIEKNNLEIFEPIFSDAECSDYHDVCPYVREKFMAAFEYASRVGERERSQFLGLSAAKFLKAARMLGAVDDGTSLTSRCDSDLVFIEATYVTRGALVLVLVILLLKLLIVLCEGLVRA
jgi:tubulin polyglutamylase TTLL6/13